MVPLLKCLSTTKVPKIQAAAREAVCSMKLLIRLGMLMVLAGTLFTGCRDPKATWRSEARAEAERDIADGKLCLKTYGKPVHWLERYRAMAKEKYGGRV